MTENLHQPKADDAVLGGQYPPPVTGAVLGGLEGIKQRLYSHSAEPKMAILEEALKYDAEGLKFVIQALKDKNAQVAIAAWNLLQNRTEPQVKYALEEYIPLLSDVDMVYFRLRDLLKAHHWSDADKQTRNILLRICNRESQWLRKEDINNLPCTDLLTIDRLWTYYSKGHFGFSAQMRIWQECVKNQNSLFSDIVGWKTIEKSAEYRIKKYFLERREGISCDLNAPPGHLPTIFEFGGGKSHEEPYTNDSESTMGFYSIDGYWTVWSSDSFFGPEMVIYFLKRFQACQG